MRDLFIAISGPKGIGKSTFLNELSKKLEGKYSLGGIITLGQKERKFLDVKTQETSRFSEEENEKGFQIGKYLISERSLNFAIKAIENSSESKIIFIDEIGRLESEKEGLYSIAQKLFSSISNSEKIVILGVRQEVVPQLTKLFSISPQEVWIIRERPYRYLLEEVLDFIIAKLG